jgi:hypothetical protein
MPIIVRPETFRGFKSVRPSDRCQFGYGCDRPALYASEEHESRPLCRQHFFQVYPELKQFEHWQP